MCDLLQGFPASAKPPPSLANPSCPERTLSTPPTPEPCTGSPQFQESQLPFCISLPRDLQEAEGRSCLRNEGPRSLPIREEWEFWINSPSSSPLEQFYGAFYMVPQRVPSGVEPQLSTVITRSLAGSYRLSSLPIFPRSPSLCFLRSPPKKNQLTQTHRTPRPTHCSLSILLTPA